MAESVPRKSPRKKTTSAKAKAQTLVSSPSNNAAKRSRHKAAVRNVQEAGRKASGGRRCHACPGKPLRAECVHTKAGRQHVAEQQLRQRISVTSGPSTTLPTESRQQPDADVPGGQPAEAAHSQQHVHFHSMNPQVILSHPDTLATGLSRFPASPGPLPTLFTPERQDGPRDQVYVLNTLPRTSHSGVIPETPTRRSGHADDGLVFPTNTTMLSSMATPASRLTQVYDPALSALSFTPERPEFATPTSALSFTPQRQEFATPTSALSFTPQRQESVTPANVQGSEETTDTPPISGGKRIKATAANPLHGNVKGAMRGSLAYSIVRNQALPPPIAESKKASKKFRDTLNSIIRKCEDLSTQTGCWLFIGAQHAAASGAPIHYASPRLCKDGGPQANALATQYLQLIKQIVESRRVDTMELQQNLERSKQEGVQLKDRVTELEAQVKNAERDAEKLQEYRRRLGIISDDES